MGRGRGSVTVMSGVQNCICPRSAEPQALLPVQYLQVLHLPDLKGCFAKRAMPDEKSDWRATSEKGGQGAVETGDKGGGGGGAEARLVLRCWHHTSTGPVWVSCPEANRFDALDGPRAGLGWSSGRGTTNEMAPARESFSP